MRTAALLISALLGLPAVTVHAQSASAPQQRASSADRYFDCAERVRRILHDHGMERGYGPAPVIACVRAAHGNAGERVSAGAQPPAAGHDRDKMQHSR